MGFFLIVLYLYIKIYMKLSDKEKNMILELHRNMKMKPWLFEQLTVGPGGVVRPTSSFDSKGYEQNLRDKGINIAQTSLRQEPAIAKPIYGPMPKDISGTKEFKAAIESEKNKVDPQTYEEFVENLRQIVYHPISVGVEVVISMFGIGRVTVAGVYGFLLLEDFRKASNGDFSSENMFNMLMDLLGVVFSGAYTRLLAPFRNKAKGLKTGIQALIEWLAKQPIWSKLKPILESLVNIGKTIGGTIKLAAEEFAESSLGQLLRLASKGIYNTVKYVLGLGVQGSSWISKVIGLISESLSKVAGASDEIAKKIGKGVEIAVPNIGIAYGIEAMMSNKKNPEEEMMDKLISSFKIAEVEPSEKSKEQAKTIKFD